MYATYFILFANFFVKAYFSNRRNHSALNGTGPAQVSKGLKVN